MPFWRCCSSPHLPWPRAPLPLALHHTAAAVAGGRLFVIGGFGLDGAAVDGVIYVFGGRTRGANIAVTEGFDPRTDAWRSAPPLPTPRHGLAAVAVDDRVFTISGGPRPGGIFSNTTEVYIPD